MHINFRVVIVAIIKTEVYSSTNFLDLQILRHKVNSIIYREMRNAYFRY